MRCARLIETMLLVFCCTLPLAAQQKKPADPPFTGAKQPMPDKAIGVECVRAFPELRPRRPIVSTHFGDGTNRLVIASQQGVIHVLPYDESAKETQTFLDIEAKVEYQDKENEKGFLGLAFHPKFKENGQFFVFYTPKAEKPHTTVVSRFRVSKDDPSKGDPASEEVLLRVEHPYWNHKGGTICFGPDGYLYIALGDGGAARDPHENGQNISKLLGKILRIDVDKHDAGKKYAIPADNPFAKKEGAAPEVFAYGLRNVWRMSFDRVGGQLWAADVGQDIWEEIDLITAGGNYGWNRREGLHPFGNKGVGPNNEMIEPIWEYHHDIGKSITGGNVYRGKKVPELVGKYLYADYVTGKIWALDYDAKSGKVNANYSVPCVDQNPPVITFGEGPDGELYCSTAFGLLYKFQSKK